MILTSFYLLFLWTFEIHSMYYNLDICDVFLFCFMGPTNWIVGYEPCHESMKQYACIKKWKGTPLAWVLVWVSMLSKIFNYMYDSASHSFCVYELGKNVWTWNLLISNILLITENFMNSPTKPCFQVAQQGGKIRRSNNLNE